MFYKVVRWVIMHKVIPSRQPLRDRQIKYFNNGTLVCITFCKFIFKINNNNRLHILELLFDVKKVILNITKKAFQLK